ncbi:hypothetical protein [Thermococcus pacificus]|uniref:Uncharacterized protein n=1 Tax=Thermococcus pacificus TaxID=71998 RepID=A0A218P6K8_9EURY|nr:hypothetical protein [Thermococcus pacificus]ASJ06428.1 hypothetical protein A3L08_03315 [Thermococcus pacificus]
MRRRGQILSLDAMLALVMVVVMLGTITSTSTALQNEISTMVSWYDRANIASNMLDVLTKNPGDPANWIKDASKLRSLGLRSDTYPYAVSYEKISALMQLGDDTAVVNSLISMSNNKDFELHLYLTNTTVSLTGNFPKRVFIDLSDGKDRNMQIGQGSTGNNPFDATNVTLNGDKLPKRNQPYSLSPGDVLAFYTLEDITVHDRKNGEDYPIPAPAYVGIQVISTGSHFQVQWTDRGLHITGQGQVRIIVEGYQKNTIQVNVDVTEPEELTAPSYRIAVINGSKVNDDATIQKSRDRSPWVEYIERKVTVEKLKYEESIDVDSPSTTEWIAGRLTMNVPEYAYFRVTVAPQDTGRIILIARDGDEYRGVLIEKQSEDSALQAVVATSGDSSPPKFYIGNTTSVDVPWSSIFQAFDTSTGSKVILVWIYGNTFGGTAKITDMGHLGTIMKPKFERTMLKLWVWDDS